MDEIHTDMRGRLWKVNSSLPDNSMIMENKHKRYLYIFPFSRLSARGWMSCVTLTLEEAYLQSMMNSFLNESLASHKALSGGKKEEANNYNV